MLSSEGADPHEVEASELTEMSGHDTTWEDMPDFPCLVASSVLKKYNQLSARGKPLTGTEWTPLAAILQYDGVCVCCRCDDDIADHRKKLRFKKKDFQQQLAS